jgi:hypothetical protein
MEPLHAGGAYTSNVNRIFDYNTAMWKVKTAMKLSNQTLLCVVYCGQPVDTTAAAKMPMRGGCSKDPLYDILPQLAEGIIDDTMEESNDGC